MDRSTGVVDNKAEILEYLKAQKTRLEAEYKLRSIALFGSFARDEQSENSDIDILIEIPEGTPDLFLKKRALKEELEKHFGRKVELASQRYLKDYYKQNVISEAIYV
jgi:predicted nucleotidyltransferase